MNERCYIQWTRIVHECKPFIFIYIFRCSRCDALEIALLRIITFKIFYKIILLSLNTFKIMKTFSEKFILLPRWCISPLVFDYVIFNSIKLFEKIFFVNFARCSKFNLTNNHLIWIKTVNCYHWTSWLCPWCKSEFFGQLHFPLLYFGFKNQSITR